MNGNLTIILLGIFKKTYGNGKISMRLKKKERLRDVIQKIVKTSPILGRLLVDPELKDPRPNSVIVVNGKEISVLDGLETIVGDRDEIVFIPVIHGG